MGIRLAFVQGIRGVVTSWRHQLVKSVKTHASWAFLLEFAQSVRVVQVCEMSKPTTCAMNDQTCLNLHCCSHQRGQAHALQRRAHADVVTCTCTLTEAHT